MIDRLLKPVHALCNRYILHKNAVACGKGVTIRGRLYVMGKNIVIQDGATINSGFQFNPIGGQTRTLLITQPGGKIVIGKRAGLSNCAIVAADRVEIQDDVKIGGSCKIYDTDFHSVDYAHRTESPDTHVKTAPVLIRRGAFIGAHTLILKGVTIGERSVVGAGSIVVESIPDDEVWAGNPAKFVRKL